jgi:hypothetical protein
MVLVYTFSMGSIWNIFCPSPVGGTVRGFSWGADPNTFLLKDSTSASRATRIVSEDSI